jgi:hypothetical protein
MSLSEEAREALTGKWTNRWKNRWVSLQIVLEIRKLRIQLGIPTQDVLNWIVFCWPFIWSFDLPKNARRYTEEELDQFYHQKLEGE